MSVYEDFRQAQQEIHQLQRALMFWLPCVPAEGEQKIIDRIAHDAFLLVGYEPSGDDPQDEKSAQELGWIELMPTIEELPANG